MCGTKQGSQAEHRSNAPPRTHIATAAAVGRPTVRTIPPAASHDSLADRKVSFELKRLPKSQSKSMSTFKVIKSC